MTEVCTAKRLSVVLLACPLDTYIKEGGREKAGQVWVRQGGVLLGLLVQVGFGPPFSFLPPEGKVREREGGRPPPLVQFGLGKGRGAPLTWPFLLSSNKAH